MSERRNANTAGFSIVEMVITLVLLGVLLSIAITKTDGTVWKLDTSVSQVIQRARVARSIAILRQHDVVVTFEGGSRARVVLHEDSNSDGARDDGERVTSYPLETGVRFTRNSAPPYGSFSANDVSFTDKKVTFRRNGSCSEEGAVYVGSENGEGSARAVVFTRATGYTHVYKHTGSGWVAP